MQGPAAGWSWRCSLLCSTTPSRRISQQFGHLTALQQRLLRGKVVRHRRCRQPKICTWTFSGRWVGQTICAHGIQLAAVPPVRLPIRLRPISLLLWVEASRRILVASVLALAISSCCQAQSDQIHLPQVVQRTASTVAAWNSVGFTHGVLNTDNMSIVGLTLDYGPFGKLPGQRQMRSRPEGDGSTAWTRCPDCCAAAYA